MSGSVYRETELVGVSSESWEAAARNAVETASKTVRDLRIGEAHRFDVTITGRHGGELPRTSERVVQVRIWRPSSLRRELGTPPVRRFSSL